VFTVAKKIIQLQSPEDEEAAAIQGIADEAARIAAMDAEIGELRQRAAELKAVMADARAAGSELSLVRRMAPAAAVAAQAMDLARTEQVRRKVAEVRAAEAREHGNRALRIADTLSAAAATVQAQVKPAAKLSSEMVEPHFERRQRLKRTRHQVIGQERTTLRLFLEVCGDRPVNDYNRGDVTRFLETLRKLPNTYGKSPRDQERTVRELIARADLEGKDRLKEKTVERHLSALSQFFDTCVDDGQLTAAARLDMLSRHAFEVPDEAAAARDERDPWTLGELQTLFSSPCWAGAKSAFYRAVPGTHIERDGKFWIPLLCVLHGTRLEEVADLYRRDIVEVDGIWCMDIRPSLIETPGEAARRRTLKTATSRRRVPLHPDIVRMGFLDYVERIAPGAADAIFPDIEPQGRDGKRGPRITKWFGHYRKHVKLFRAGVASHSFRHNVQTALRNVCRDYQDARALDYLFGHLKRGASEGEVRYDKGPGLAVARDLVARLSYPGLDFSHLFVR
jgi:hypothetical protein